MKKNCLFVFILLAAVNLSAQNVGIGTTEPQNKLQVQGSLLVTTPTAAAGTAPTVAQTKTMVNASTIRFSGGDSTGRIYDPGGPAGSYNTNTTAYASIIGSSNTGFEITAESMDLATGDSLIIRETSGDTLLAVGNGYTATGKWVFNSAGLYIIFKSNADVNVGAGFSLLIRRLYSTSASLPDMSGFNSNTFFFDTKNGALRSGKIKNGVRGDNSTAMGIGTTASGTAATAMGLRTSASGGYSTAIGDGTVASGISSTAMGEKTIASGKYSTAMGKYTEALGYASTAMGDSSLASGSFSFASGFGTTASRSYSTAMGFNTTASGAASFAMGDNSTASGGLSFAIGLVAIASGSHSTAMGSYVSTNNQEGSFIIGDNSTSTLLNSANANNFRARFAGGYRLFTSANLSTGCTLFAGDNAWTTGSDVNTKENFAAVNGEDFLKKISNFHLTSWNYKTQNPKAFRHYGPMAQDFYSAFGKDKYGTIGNDTTINSADFAGVSFIAIQALEKRTQKIEQLEKENVAIKNDNAEMKTMLLQLRKEMDVLKQPGNKNL